MEITLNEKKLNIEPGTTLAQLLDTQGIKGKYVAVAIENAIIKATEWENRILNDGEKILVIGAIKGG